MSYILKGLSFFPLDVDFLAHRKMRLLRSAYGNNGILLYIYLLTEIYREGYYLDMDEDMLWLISGDLDVEFEKVSEMISFLYKHDIFDADMFEKYSILTSYDIQSHFQYAVSARGYKNAVKVNGNFWLLPENETKSYIKVTEEKCSCTAIESNSIEKDLNSMEKRNNSMEFDTNKIKENKIKLNNTTPTPAEGEEEEYAEKVCNDFLGDKRDFTDNSKPVPIRNNCHKSTPYFLTKCIKNDIILNILIHSNLKEKGTIYEKNNTAYRSGSYSHDCHDSSSSRAG